MAIALTTLAEIKTYLGVTGTGSDTILTALAEAAEDAIFRYTNRPDGFASGSKTEYFDGELYDELPALLYSPITAVATIKISTGEGTWSTLTLSGLSIDGFPLDGTAFTTHKGIIRFRSHAGQTWAFETGQMPYTPIHRGANFGAGRDTVQVVYTGGYSAIPASLEQAAIQMTAMFWKSKDLNEALQSEHLGEYSYTSKIILPTERLPTAIKSLLGPFRRMGRSV